MKTLSFSLLRGFVIVLLVLQSPAFAQNNPAELKINLSEFLMNNAFLLTVVLIFLSALVTAVLSARSRDRCLKDFRDYPVIIELEKERKLVWGNLHLYSNGLELSYLKPHKDLEGHIETSFVLYKDEWPGMIALFRCADELDEKTLKRRRIAIRRTYQPSVFRKSLRSIKNLFNTLRDAVNKSLGVFLGQVKKAMPSSKVLSTQDSAIKNIGESFVEYTSYAYDAILENMIGKKVVVEVPRQNTLLEYPGILKEYSGNFIEILSVHSPLKFFLPVPPKGHTIHFRHLEVLVEDKTLRLQNKGKNRILLIGLLGEGLEQKWGYPLAPNESFEKIFDEPVSPDVKIEIQVPGDVDIILPRSLARIRHRGEVETFDWKTFFGLK